MEKLSRSWSQSWFEYLLLLSVPPLFTSMELFINKMKDHLTKDNPFAYGDAATKYHSGVNCKEDGDRGDTGRDFGVPISMSILYQNFLDRIHDMTDSEDLTFTVIISDPLSNSFMGPVPSNSATLLLRSERSSSRTAMITMSKMGWRWRNMGEVTRSWVWTEFWPRTTRRTMETYV